MDRSRFDFFNYFSNQSFNIINNNSLKQNRLFILNDIKFEPIFFYIDFSLPENQHLKPEDFFSMNLILLYIKTIDIY